MGGGTEEGVRVWGEVVEVSVSREGHEGCVMRWGYDVQ